MQNAVRFFRSALLGCWLLTAGGAGGAADTTATAEGEVSTQRTPAGAVVAPVAAGAGITSGILAAQQDVVRAKESDPDSEPAAAASDLLKEASEQLKLRDRFSSETQANLTAVREAPAQLQIVKDALAADDKGTTPPRHMDLPTTASAEMVEHELVSARAELKVQQEYLAEIQSELQKRSSRAEAIPRELVEARHKQSEAHIALQADANSEEALVANARRLLARARLAAADAQTSALQTEQARYQAREELLPLGRQLMSLRVDETQASIANLEARLAELRKAEASATARELKRAEQETLTSHPLVRRVAAENTSITATMNLGKVVELQDRAQEQLRDLREQVEQTSTTFNNLRFKFESVGYSDALGVLLRRQRRELPNLRRHREQVESLDASLANTNLDLLETQDRLNALANPDAIARSLVASEMDTSTTESRSIRSEISQLLQARRDYLGKLADAYEKLIQTLLELNTAEKELVQSSADFKAFIDERIFWLPSTDRLSGTSLKAAAKGVSAVLSPSLLASYGEALKTEARTRPFTCTLGLLLLMASVVMHRHWRRMLKQTLESSGRSRLAGFTPMARCLVYAGLCVSPLPLVLLGAGLSVAGLLQVPVVVSSLGDGLVSGGFALFSVLYARILSRRGGVAEVFFAWREDVLRRLRRIFSTLIWMYVPAIILLQMWRSADGDNGMEAARLVLIVVLAGIATIAWGLFAPKKSILRGTSFGQPNSLFSKLRYLIVAAAVGLPVLLIVGSVMGYFFTALELSVRLNMTVWIALALLLLREVAFFWVLVSRRRLAIEEARKRREAARAQQAGESEGQSTSADLPAVPAEPAIDIAAISDQAGRLLRVAVSGIFLLALWGIWVEVLPALHYLDSLTLWSVSRTVSEVDAASGTIVSMERLMPVTLVSLLFATLIGVALVIALRNIPGLLDISIYQRYGVQKGEKYAFNTLIRYLLIIAGITWILYLLGLQWKHIQWLVAAVSVGLGFGLQEIFANFVSGVILLFERPIRVGDIVTVGDQTGRVTQIRIRGTTVVNWDHKILIIPNKELITKPVLNWTLVNTMQRLVMTVRVSHGVDYDLVREILLKAARDNPYILNDPAPAAALDTTSLDSVDFVLLVHLANGDNVMDARHQIISEVERNFRSAGIELAVSRMKVELAQDGKAEATP